jgi:hypothetical protein
VTATIGYQDVKSGDFLAVGVFDLDDGNLVDGLGSSNPQPCTAAAHLAGCIVAVANQQGSEIMQFSLDRPKEVWNLALIAALLDTAKDPISDSFSDYTFTVSVQTGLTLTVNLPENVQVKVDGVNGSGSVQLLLVAGNHTISVPDLVTVNSTTRLRFLGWSDGVTAPNRSIALNHDITLTGNYVFQYRLELISPVNVVGAGWYDSGANVRLSVESASQSMGGVMGFLGGKWVFQGWAEGPVEISRSQTTNVTMDSAQVINALWVPDYSVPLAVAAVISLLSAAGFYVMRLRTRETGGRPRQRIRRSQSRKRSRT